jgi:hypothetical protein
VPADPPPPPRAWSYEVQALGSGVQELRVQADFSTGASESLETDSDAAPYVHDVQVWSGGAWRAAARQEDSWTASCRAGCRVQYRFALREAAVQLDSIDFAMAAGGLVIAPPSSWLLRPSTSDGRGRYRFRVRMEGDARFATGIAPAPDGAPDTFEAATSGIDGASFAVFGPLHLQTIQSGESRVDVAIAPQGIALPEPDVVAWIHAGVTNVAAYYGRLPVRRTLVIVVPDKENDIEGETMGDGGPAIVVRAAKGMTLARAHDDWVVTHELLHVALPALARTHSWLSEGIATYVEPIVRARAGLVTPERFWRDLVKGAPKGLPQRGDQGLERTHTWGRTYWGGALFCLVADVRIRQETKGARSLDDALRAIALSGANVEEHWSIERFLAEGDRATGTAVFAGLYREMGLAPAPVDLAALWSQLGIRVGASDVVLDDGAPLASIRRAITSPNANIDAQRPKSDPPGPPRMRDR